MQQNNSAIKKERKRLKRIIRKIKNKKGKGDRKKMRKINLIKISLFFRNNVMHSSVYWC